MPLQDTPPLVLRMSRVTVYPFLATATTCRKPTPLVPVCLHRVPRNHDICTRTTSNTAIDSFSQNKKSTGARLGLSCDLQDCEMASEFDDLSQLGGFIGGSLGPTFDELSARKICPNFFRMMDLMRAQRGGFSSGSGDHQHSRNHPPIFSTPLPSDDSSNRDFTSQRLCKRKRKKKERGNPGGRKTLRSVREWKEGGGERTKEDSNRRTTAHSMR